MNPIDILILSILLISTSISFFRGGVREFLSLIVWVVAVLVAMIYTHQVTVLLAPHLSMPALRIAVSFIFLFMTTLMLGTVVNYLLGSFIKKNKLSTINRMIGALFGLARAVVVVSVVVLLASLMSKLPGHAWWKTSVMVDYFTHLLPWLREQLPPELVKYVTVD